MKQKVRILLVVLLLTAWGGLAPVQPVQAAETIEANGTALQMVLTETGGVSLNLSGVTKYFKVWDKDANTLTRINLAHDNILSYDVDGSKLYFIVNVGAYTQVYNYDISTGVTQQVTTSFTNKREVQAAGGRVAWFDYGRSALVIRNMNDGGAEKEISVDASHDVELSLTEDYVAYTAHKHSKSSVLLYSFATGETSIIKEGNSIKSGVCLQGNNLVWVEGGGANNSGTGYYNLVWGNYVKSNALNKVYYHNILTGETKLITNNDMNNLQPAVWENYLTWAQTYNGIPEIMLLDLNTNITTRVTTNDYVDSMPALDHGCFTYITLRGANGDLYVQYMEAPAAPEPETPAAPEAPAAEAGAEIPIYINGEKLVTDQAPYIKNNCTMVPMRAIFEALGAEVQWNDADRSVTATREGATVLLSIDQTTAYRNGQAEELDVAPELIGAAEQTRTMVPARFVSESLGCTVSWDDAARAVYIVY